MTIKVSYQNLDKSKYLDAFIYHRIKIISSKLKIPMNVNWVCSKKNNSFHSHVKLSTKEYTCFASSSDDSIYSTVDEIIQKLKKQISKRRRHTKKYRKSDLFSIDPVSSSVGYI